jgi:hypothetical protein
MMRTKLCFKKVKVKRLRGSINQRRVISPPNHKLVISSSATLKEMKQEIQMLEQSTTQLMII